MKSVLASADQALSGAKGVGIDGFSAGTFPFRDFILRFGQGFGGGDAQGQAE
jgi:hypothetical protein